jgi:signal transduction histidine kinase
MSALEHLAASLWRHASAPRGRYRQSGWFVGVALVAAVTGVIELLKPHASVSGLVVLYLLAVLPVAVAWGTTVAVAVSLLSAAAFAFFFLPPTHTLDPSKPEDGVALGVFVLTALVVAELSARSNREARAAERLAGEHAALRRVATLVARGAPPEEVFAAVAEEVGRLLGTHLAGMARYESDDTVTVLATWAAEGEHGGAHPLVPGPWPLEGGDLASTIRRTGRSVRIDDYHGVPGRIAAFVREELGVSSSVASPIVVEGRLWGVLFVHSKQTHQPLPRDAESRLTGFTELVATAIANAESRSELAASRARIVAASDETRRRVERDLHDGAQQRLVTLGLALRSAQAELPHDLEEVRAQLSDIGQGLTAVLDELREISRGIHPAILSQGGLAPALKTLARRSPIPVALDVRLEGRLPIGAEVAAYYVISEMLTNTAKHAQASTVYVDVARADEALHVSVRDDGVGGADPARGSGLVGLRDRVEALGGTIVFQSAKGAGTAVEVVLPLGRTREASGQVRDTPRDNAI